MVGVVDTVRKRKAEDSFSRSRLSLSTMPPSGPPGSIFIFFPVFKFPDEETVRAPRRRVNCGKRAKIEN